MTKRALVLLSIVAAGCAGQGSSSSSATGELSIQEGQGTASGYFIDHSQADLGRVDFNSRFVDTNVLDIELRFHGMSITAVVDFDSGVIEHDGFASDNGASTQMLEDDRALVLAFAHALDGRGSHVSEAVQRLRSFSSTWAEYPTTVELQGISLMDVDRGYTSICWALNTYQAASHDCTWNCPWYNPFCSNSVNSWWTDSTTLDYAYVSMHGAGPCNDGTYFLNSSGQWQCYEPSHVATVEQAYGNCMGRCGSGCGSDTQFTWDCLYHDECVRVGHDTAAASCDDQFTSTTDDWAAAPDCL